MSGVEHNYASPTKEPHHKKNESIIINNNIDGETIVYALLISDILVDMHRNRIDNSIFQRK